MSARNSEPKVAIDERNPYEGGVVRMALMMALVQMSSTAAVATGDSWAVEMFSNYYLCNKHS